MHYYYDIIYLAGGADHKWQAHWPARLVTWIWTSYVTKVAHVVILVTTWSLHVQTVRLVSWVKFIHSISPSKPAEQLTDLCELLKMVRWLHQPPQPLLTSTAGNFLCYFRIPVYCTVTTVKYMKITQEIQRCRYRRQDTFRSDPTFWSWWISSLPIILAKIVMIFSPSRKHMNLCSNFQRAIPYSSEKQQNPCRARNVNVIIIIFCPTVIP